MAARSNPYALFDAKVPVLGPRLMQELDIRDFHAAAVYGNAGQESGGFRFLQEKRPTVKGSRGGFGPWMWTGGRRVGLEKWCLDHGLALTDDEAHFGFLLHELRTSEAGTLRGLKATTTLHAATETFMLLFERPGVPALGNRVTWAERALRLIHAADDAVRDQPVKALPLPAPTVTPPPVPAKPDSAWEAARKRLIAHYGAHEPHKES